MVKSNSNRVETQGRAKLPQLLWQASRFVQRASKNPSQVGQEPTKGGSIEITLNLQWDILVLQLPGTTPKSPISWRFTANNELDERPLTDGYREPRTSRYAFDPNKLVALENVQNEVMALVISSRLWIVVLPLSVIDWNSHLLRVAVVQILSAAVILVAPEVLRIVYIRIVIESVPITNAKTFSPNSAKRLLRMCLVG